jgi:nicotinate-nucleotide adenylyltransferase
MGQTAIFGGTFNPFHIGHYEILEALQNDEEIDEIFLMPDRIPPHKDFHILVDDEVRIEMCRIATEDFSKVKLCLIEFEREGKSYTYDTVLLLKERYPDKKFAFVCGGDMLVYFPKWYKYKELIKLMAFIVFKRTDTNMEEFDATIKSLSDSGMKIKLKDELISSVSSTAIRNNFDENADFLPKKIRDFLNKRGVYIE